MTVYDSNVIINCKKGKKEYCNIILSDDNCNIVPTVASEVRGIPKDIKNHCRVYTYDDPPFSNEYYNIIEFADYFDRNYMKAKPKRGKGHREWNSALRRFQKYCVSHGEPYNKINDAKIVFETNILAKEGLDDTLITGDSGIHATLCREMYEHAVKSFGYDWLIEIKDVKEELSST